MANYFAKFPTVMYRLSNDISSEQLITNILSRYVIEKEIRENMIFYDFYDIRDGDTPENLAHKIYKSSERHWLILAANDIIDVEAQWPLTFQQLVKYINIKYTIYGDQSEYGGLEWAKNNIKSYYRVENIIQNSKTISSKQFEIDQTTHANLAIELSETTNSVIIQPSTEVTLSDGNTITVTNTLDTKTYFEYEEEQNEAKRRIKILRLQYVDSVERELERVFSE